MDSEGMVDCGLPVVGVGGRWGVGGGSMEGFWSERGVMAGRGMSVVVKRE